MGVSKDCDAISINNQYLCETAIKVETRVFTLRVMYVTTYNLAYKHRVPNSSRAPAVKIRMVLAPIAVGTCTQAANDARCRRRLSCGGLGGE